MAGMRPRQSLVDLLFLVLLLLGVLNFFSPVIGVARDPVITYAFVGLAGVVFGIGHTSRNLPGRRAAPQAADTPRSGDSEV